MAYLPELSLQSLKRSLPSPGFQSQKTLLAKTPSHMHTPLSPHPCFKLPFWEPMEPLAPAINYAFLGILLFSSLTVFPGKRVWVFFFSQLFLHSSEGFLLTWTIIKNQSNKVTFSNLTTGYKKLNCQALLAKQHRDSNIKSQRFFKTVIKEDFKSAHI